MAIHNERDMLVALPVVGFKPKEDNILTLRGIQRIF
jgi:hypothetical protein